MKADVGLALTDLTCQQTLLHVLHAADSGSQR
jgi:hypothetical protein